jgi:hypothetical protein
VPQVERAVDSDEAAFLKCRLHHTACGGTHGRAFLSVSSVEKVTCCLMDFAGAGMGCAALAACAVLSRLP